MHDAGAVALLAAIYAGLALLALAVAGLTRALARTRAAVIAGTSVAALLLLAHFAALLFLGGMGRAWGGSGEPLPEAVGVATGILAAIVTAAVAMCGWRDARPPAPGASGEFWVRAAVVLAGAHVVLILSAWATIVARVPEPSAYFRSPLPWAGLAAWLLATAGLWMRSTPGWWLAVGLSVWAGANTVRWLATSPVGVLDVLLTAAGPGFLVTVAGLVALLHPATRRACGIGA